MKKIFLLIGLILLPYLNFAQSDSINRSTSNVLFGKGAISTNQPSIWGNAFKINVFDPLSGKYGIYFERELNVNFSVEIGGGITGRSFVGNSIGRILYQDDSQQSPTFTQEFDIVDEDYNFEGRNAKIGVFASLMPRYYFKSNYGLNGTYMGLSFQYIKYNYLAYGIDPYESLSGIISYVDNEKTMDEYESHINIGVTYGKQILKGSFSIDYFVSTGIKSLKGVRRDTGYYYNDLTFETIPIVASEPRKISKFTLYFEAGIKLGLWWE